MMIANKNNFSLAELLGTKDMIRCTIRYNDLKKFKADMETLLKTLKKSKIYLRKFKNGLMAESGV